MTVGHAWITKTQELAIGAGTVDHERGSPAVVTHVVTHAQISAWKPLQTVIHAVAPEPPKGGSRPRAPLTRPSRYRHQGDHE